MSKFVGYRNREVNKMSVHLFHLFFTSGVEVVEMWVELKLSDEVYMTVADCAVGLVSGQCSLFAFGWLY